MRLEQFLFCEMARNEVNGQLSLIGVYSGSQVTIELPENAPLQLLPNLHVVVTLADMQRVARFRYQCVVKHDNIDVITVPVQEIERPIPAPPFQNLLFGFSPFLLTRGPGDYEFRVIVQPQAEPAPTTFSKRFRVGSTAPTAQRH
jgi:hypothetical protein